MIFVIFLTRLMRILKKTNTNSNTKTDIVLSVNKRKNGPVFIFGVLYEK